MTFISRVYAISQFSVEMGYSSVFIVFVSFVRRLQSRPSPALPEQRGGAFTAIRRGSSVFIATHYGNMTVLAITSGEGKNAAGRSKPVTSGELRDFGLTGERTPDEGG